MNAPISNRTPPRTSATTKSAAAAAATPASTPPAPSPVAAKSTGWAPKASPKPPQKVAVAPASAKPATLSPAGAATVAQVKTLLSTNVAKLDFMVTQAEAKQALAQLATLSPQDFALAMKDLGASGHLATMLDKLPGVEQQQFLKMATQRGYLTQEPGERATGKFNPPNAPDLYRENAALPRCVNDVIHEQSKVSIENYKREYDSYVGRYSAAVGQCKSLAEIRALGRPVQPTGTWELTDPEDRKAEQYHGDWNLTLSQSSPLHAYLAVSDRMTDLAKERRDGSAWFDLKLEGRIGGFGAEVDLTTGDPSRDVVKSKTAFTPTVKSGDTKLGAKFKSDGTVEVNGSTKVKDVPVGGAVTLDEKGAVKKGSGTIGWLTMSSDGKTAQVNLRATKGEAGPIKGEVGSYASLNKEKAEMRGGVQGKGSLGDDIDFKFSIGFGVKGSTAPQADVYSRPAELDQHVAWNALPPARRQQIQASGWSEAEWNKAMVG